MKDKEIRLLKFFINLANPAFFVSGGKEKIILNFAGYLRNAELSAC